MEAVVTAATGNSYGVSNAAAPSYNETFKSLSPNEVKLMLDLTKAATMVKNRMPSNSGCEKRFRALSLSST